MSLNKWPLWPLLCQDEDQTMEKELQAEVGQNNQSRKLSK